MNALSVKKESGMEEAGINASLYLRPLFPFSFFQHCDPHVFCAFCSSCPVPFLYNCCLASAHLLLLLFNVRFELCCSPKA